MKAYRLTHGATVEGLQLDTIEEQPLGAYEVRVAVKAVSLNFRDLMIAGGGYPVKQDSPIIPCSDGAGEVIAVGSYVTRVNVGDRVMASFFPNWLEGPVDHTKIRSALGGDTDGMLAEAVTLHENTLVQIPAELSFVEASTIPCATVTAWNALFEATDLRPGAKVLFLGTGGVSILGLQMAKAAGFKTIITSSSDAKLERVRDLGADETINYRSTPEWQDEVLRLTNGVGVDLVLEVGGEGTMTRSVAATAIGGTIAAIGGVSGFNSQVSPSTLLTSAKRLVGVYVGSRRMLEQAAGFMASTGVRPVVGSVFSFDEAKEAYQHLASGQHFGKVVIDFTR